MKINKKSEITVFFMSLLYYREMIFDCIVSCGLPEEQFFNFVETLKICDNLISSLENEYSFLRGVKFGI